MQAILHDSAAELQMLNERIARVTASLEHSPRTTMLSDALQACRVSTLAPQELWWSLSEMAVLPPGDAICPPG